MAATRSATRFAAVVAKQRQVEALRNAESVIDRHAQWVLSHLSQADRDMIFSVTGEVIDENTTNVSMFAMTLAESRVKAAAAASANVVNNPMVLAQRANAMSQHDRVATFTSMRAMMNGGNLGRCLDMEA